MPKAKKSFDDQLLEFVMTNDLLTIDVTLRHALKVLDIRKKAEQANPRGAVPVVPGSLGLGPHAMTAGQAGRDQRRRQRLGKTLAEQQKEKEAQEKALAEAQRQAGMNAASASPDAQGMVAQSPEPAQSPVEA